MARFEILQPIIYTKAGTRPCWNTEWPAVYLRERPDGFHEIKVEGWKRVRRVKIHSISETDCEKRLAEFRASQSEGE